MMMAMPMHACRVASLAPCTTGPGGRPDQMRGPLGPTTRQSIATLHLPLMNTSLAFCRCSLVLNLIPPHACMQIQPAAVALMQPPKPRLSAEGRSAGLGTASTAFRPPPPLLTAVLDTARDLDVRLGMAAQPGRPIQGGTTGRSRQAVASPSATSRRDTGPMPASSSRVPRSRAAQTRPVDQLSDSPPAERFPGRSPGQRGPAAEGAALRASLGATSASSYTGILDAPASGIERQWRGRMGTTWAPEGGGISADRLLLDNPGDGERQPGSAWLTAGSATATSEGRRIAARIRASGDWFQLRAVLSVSRESLNMLHMTSALSRLAAVAGYDKQVRQSTGGACIRCTRGAAVAIANFDMQVRQGSLCSRVQGQLQPWFQDYASVHIPLFPLLSYDSDGSLVLWPDEDTPSNMIPVLNIWHNVVARSAPKA